MLKVVFFLQGVKCRQIAKTKTPSSTDPFLFPFFFFWKAQEKREALFMKENPLFSETWQWAMQKENGNLQKAPFNAHLHWPVGSLQSPAQMSAFPQSQGSSPACTPRASKIKAFALTERCKITVYSKSGSSFLLWRCLTNEP